MMGGVLKITYGDTEENEVAIVRAAELTQVFNHGTHHRGQISTGFANFGMVSRFVHQGLGDFFQSMKPCLLIIFLPADRFNI